MADDPLIGRHLANFRIERLLGRGGMAQVYFGHDVKLRRPVAIKLIDARYRGDVTYAERFVREAQTVATWRHENILQVYYADEQDGLYYFVMEYIDGPDLSRLLADYADEGALMPHADVARIGSAVASALDYAHSQGVIHRDVKPSNVMIASDGRVALADFGLAMDVEQGSLGEIFGTPHYIAPEQARRSADAVPQSDLYSLGVMLYEMLTGAVPFDDPSPTSLALQHLTVPPPPPREINPNLSAETEAVLLKALNKSPRDRYQSGGALMDALEHGLRAAPDARIELPPSPAEARRLSRLSVTERVAQHIGATHTPAAYPEPLVPATRHRQDARIALSTRGGRAARVALGLVAALVVITAVWFLALRDEEDGASTAPEVSPTPPSAATAIAVSSPTMTDTPVPPTETPTAAQTVTLTAPPAAATPSVTPTAMPMLPSATVTPAPSATPAATFTSPPPAATLTETPSATPSAIATPPAAVPSPTPTLPPTAAPLPAPSPTPTVLYPNGRRFVLRYDENTLFMRNTSGDEIQVRSFAFERLDTTGDPLNGVEGSRWAQFYPYIRPQSCIKILILNSASYLSPPSCQAINSEVWAERGRSLDFWTPQDGSSQFRVLWNDQEIGRCEISAGTCEVFVP
jgi:serine/threonine protein kinase